MEIKITNIVIKVVCIDQFDLENLRSKFKCIGKKRCDRFDAIYLKIDGACLLVFRSGKIIVTGIKTFDIEPILANIIKDPPISKEIVNITATSKISLCFESFIRKSSFITYEPELFPAANWYPGFGPHIIVYHTGSLIITGAKDIVQIENALKLFCKDICEK